MIYAVGTLLIDLFINLLLESVKPPISSITFTLTESTTATFGDVAPSNTKIAQVNTILHNGVWDYFKIFAIGLTLCYFIVEINKKWAFEGNSMTIKSMFVPFMKLMIFIVCMYYLADLFSALLSFNDAMIAKMYELGRTLSYQEFPKDASIGQQLAASTNFWGKVILIVVGVVGMAVGVLVKLVWVYKGLLYRVELLARAMFAPVACADIYSGQNSAFIKYIKGTVALLLYGACLVIIPQITEMVAVADFMATSEALSLEALVTDPFKTAINSGANVLMMLVDCIQIIIAPIAAIGLTGTAKTLMREAVGA